MRIILDVDINFVAPVGLNYLTAIPDVNVVGVVIAPAVVTSRSMIKVSMDNAVSFAILL